MSARLDHHDGAPASHDRASTNIKAQAHDSDNDVDADDVEYSKSGKKRKRVVKTPLDKKYECSAEGCTKSYSRAEHLYRHQLNHTPKQIYKCDHPGCDRSFVRADLCTRHRERHTSKNSHLRRKDEFAARANASNAIQGSHSPTNSATMNASPNSTNTNGPTSRPAENYTSQPQHAQSYSNSSDSYHQSGVPDIAPMQSNGNTSAAYGSYNNQMGNGGNMMTPVSPTTGRRYPTYENDYSRPNGMSNNYSQPLPMHNTSSNQNMYASTQYPSPTANGGTQYRSPTNYTTSMPGYAVQPTSYGHPMDHMSVQDQYRNGLMDTYSLTGYLDQFPQAYTMPVFGAEGFNRTPPTIMPLDDAFFSQLLDAGPIDLNLPPSPPLPPEPIMSAPPMSNIPPKLEPETASTTSDKPEVMDSKASLEAGMDSNPPEIAIDEKIQQRLVKLVSRFRETEPLPGRRAKEDILAGDNADPKHALSVQMLKTSLMSYWLHIHQQMPIMHRPTFQPRTCPDLLLLTMICLGGSCLERTHPTEAAANVSELAFFAAYHIRWAVFKEPEFRPTAKLWTFQTMLLLELFEKMYSTRALHERAHIHHATTLTVMRRGSSLIGRALEIPGDNDPTRTPPGPEGSINTSGHNTHDAFWNRWITAEATRRVAFAAFVIDSTHATLFGHSAVMSPHDMRLPLPCDEALWAATSSAEVQRVEASLAANGFKPTTFLDGLKKTLNGQKVRTNTFGRVILMAGLLNISWHMNQRDLQVSSLGAKETLGSPARWRSPLTRAFDFWRKDFDDSLSKSADWQALALPSYGTRVGPGDTRDSVYESRTCLHSLAHMSMHVDIVDCEVFAGSKWSLGRAVTDGDRAAVQRRMQEWALSARARDATFYALRFLCEVLLPPDLLSQAQQQQHRTNGNGARPTPSTAANFTYSARDDYLLNRPWVLYFACMIVWSYGFALDGPLSASLPANTPPVSILPTYESQIMDMQRYLLHIGGGVNSPEDLEGLKDRNACLGLLLVLRECFAQPRWELLHEARDMLSLCVDKLVPGRVRLKSGSNSVSVSAAVSHTGDVR